MTDESLRINYVNKIIAEAKLEENPLEHLELVRDIIKGDSLSAKYCKILNDISLFLLNDYESVRAVAIDVIMLSKIKSDFIAENLILSSKKVPIYLIFNEVMSSSSPSYDRYVVMIADRYSRYKNICD